MSVDFNLVHNSISTKNDVLGNKWTHSYDVYGSVDGSGNVTIHFGDDRSLTWTKSGSVFIPPTGIFNQLVKNVDSTYTLTSTDQIKYNFTTGLQLSTIVDTNSNTITLGYTSGVLTSITDPTSRSITLSYTSGKLTGISDPLSRSWTLSYTSGDLTGIQLPVVHSNTYHYTLGYTSHNITTFTSPRGYSWTFNFNADNSIAWEKDPYLNQTSYGYNAYSGGVYTRTVTDSNSNVTTLTFDTNNRLTQVKDPLNDHEDYLYDGNWCRKQITDKRGKVWQFTFDSSGNMLTMENPLLNIWTMTYTSHNRLQSVTIPTGEATEYTYNANDRLTGVAWEDHNDVVQASTSYTVNTSGQTTDYYDANTHHYLYGYDTNGYLNSQTTPLSNATLGTYNALGFRTSREDARLRTTNYTPDGWERLVTTTYPDTSTKTYNYDADNNLTGWTDSLGTWTRRYDNADRMTQEILSATQTVAYAYDATGKKGLLSSVSDLYNTRTVTYSYTARNELYSVSETAGTTTYGYDANGNETSITNPNSTTVTEGYDDDNFQTSVVNKNSSSTVLSSFTYVPDTDNRKHTCTESDGSVTTYGYDYASRLTSDVRTGTNPYSASYVLDGNGSRTSQTIGTATTSFTLDNDDELTATSSSTGGFVNSYGYNANGEQTGRTLSGTAYTSAYDYDGQLTSLTQGSTVVSYVYDGLGRRWSRTSGGTTTKFLYDGSRLLTQFVGATITSNYTYGNALIRKDGEYPLFDGLGSERTVTNSSQTVTGTVNYDSFGNTVGTTGSSTNPYMFAATSGYRNDNDAGLMLVGARYYDAQVGRFITRDTFLDQQPYLYCEHDPVNSVDPSGHVNKRVLLTSGALGAASGILKWIGIVEPDIGVGGVVLGGVAGIVFFIGILLPDDLPIGPTDPSQNHFHHNFM